MLNQPFAVVPALHSVLFCFTHQVTSGYSMSLIRDPARGTSQFYLGVSWTSEFKQFFLSTSFFTTPKMMKVKPLSKSFKTMTHFQALISKIWSGL